MSKLNVTTSTTRPASPNTGSIFFESDTNKLIFWDGTVWHMFDRDSVTAAAEPNTLQFTLTFNNTENGYSETDLTFASDASVSSPDLALDSYSADGVANSSVKFYTVWEDSAVYDDGQGTLYEWAGWSLFSSTDGGANLNRETINYSGYTMPIVLLALNKDSYEQAGAQWGGWDHNVAAPFNLDLASDNGGYNFYIPYDGNGTTGDSGSDYEVSWDFSSGFSMNGGTTGDAFYNSRTGTVPS